MAWVVMNVPRTLTACIRSNRFIGVPAVPARKIAQALILSGVRTPIGTLNGALASAPAPELGSLCLKEALERTGVDPEEVDEVILGNVLGAGIGQNPARQASLGAGFPASVGATTPN